MKKILIVDDSTIIRNSLKTGIGGHYEVLEAEDGAIGLNVAKDNKVDMFIIDVNMPNMDGITLTSKLREIPEYQKSPIIMLTTESRAEKREQGRAVGANGWMVKPCDTEKLLGVITKLI